MAIVERHESSDRLLTLLVDVTDGDWTIGFEGGDWHTHGDLLDAWGCDGPPDAATRRFVDDILASRREICVYLVNGRVADASVPSLHDDRPLHAAFAKYAAQKETLEVRYWDGRPAAG
ncbi:MAG TPA: hypothetical protein VEA69_12895 [Tepidisphaeraceae bacterium]|nr:hypothetical protein [Tepidisphaeraceae bacterium]